MTSPVPYELMEERAAQQRRQLHNTVTQLRTTLSARLDVKRNAREYIGPAAGAATSIVAPHPAAAFAPRLFPGATTARPAVAPPHRASSWRETARALRQRFRYPAALHVSACARA